MQGNRATSVQVRIAGDERASITTTASITVSGRKLPLHMKLMN
jgi:hypothetical protein